MNGVRSKTQIELKNVMTPEDEKVHDVAMSIRSKHYAHSINNLEFPHVTAWLAVGTPKREVTSVSTASHMVVPTDETLLHNLSVLAGKLHDWAINEQKTESKRLLSIVKDRFSLDELYAKIGAASPRKIRYSDMAKVRK
ncbi:MAG: hypothetical protein WC530_11050 [Candidatus Omnitrophota bacterium]